MSAHAAGAASYFPLIEALVREAVDVILIGGIAAQIHGSGRSTTDIDFLYARPDENIVRLARALHPFNCRLRGAPEGLPFRFDAPTIKAGLNFTLVSTVGPVDFLGYVAGLGDYKSVESAAALVTLRGFPLRVANLEQLLAMKRAAGRPKDLEVLAELEMLREKRRPDA